VSGAGVLGFVSTNLEERADGILVLVSYDRCGEHARIAITDGTRHGAARWDA